MGKNGRKNKYHYACDVAGTCSVSQYSIDFQAEDDGAALVKVQKRRERILKGGGTPVNDALTQGTRSVSLSDLRLVVTN